MQRSYKTYLKDITTFVFDVDGVLTDGTVLVSTDGQLLRSMNVKDGYAIKTAVDKGYIVCIISGGSNEGVRKRLAGLGVEHIYLGSSQKEQSFNSFIKENKIDPQNVLYMGDDIPDIPPMKQVAIASCPQNAVPEVKAICNYVSHKNGANGCVRDVIEQVLKVNGQWADHFDARND
jgi:3-deoxy-D-manno-octulosonate 8-phosphate phosphatase (KDO 8-P phosphatase)